MQYRHTQFDESVNVTRRNPLKEFMTYLFAVCLLVGTIYYVSIYAVELVIPHIDRKTESRIWDGLLRDHYLVDAKRTAKTASAEKYLQALVNRIPRPLRDGDYQVIVVEDKEANALALPSGKIIIYTGLINAMKTENGLMFVLGHELGHFAHRDHLRGMGRALIAGVMLMPLFSDDSNGTSLLSHIGANLDMHFSREQESAADDYGLNVLVAVYGHAGGATEFFDYSEKQEKLPQWLEYASTHPVSKERIEYLRARIEKEKIEVRTTRPKKM